MATSGPSSTPEKSVLVPALNGDYLCEEIYITDTARTSVYASLDGVYRVSGFGNTAENIITVGGVNYLVVPDAYRSSIGDYCAIRMQ